MDDGNIIEGTAVVKLAEAAPKIRYQATIKGQTDYKLTQVENFVTEIAGKPNPNATWGLMVSYFLKRVNLTHVRMIIETHMLGFKHKIIRVNANKFTIEFKTIEGEFIENYTIQFIEI